jgi:hypothetical protein
MVSRALDVADSAQEERRDRRDRADHRRADERRPHA